MKSMTCKQLGGTCDLEFVGNSFEEIAEQSKKHGMDMFQKKDEAHMEAMNKMMALMQSKESMQEWMDNKRKEFDAIPDRD